MQVLLDVYIWGVHDYFGPQNYWYKLSRPQLRRFPNSDNIPVMEKYLSSQAVISLGLKLKSK